jgi:hypothetical protein
LTASCAEVDAFAESRAVPHAVAVVVVGFDEKV